MKRVLDIGQCSYDHSSISSFLESQFGAQVDRADQWSDAELLLQAAEYGLVLINRLLDVDHTPGMEILERLKNSPDYAEIPVMIVSNYDGAQQAAVAAGALDGFGKSALNSAETKAKIASALDA